MDVATVKECVAGRAQGRASAASRAGGRADGRTGGRADEWAVNGWVDGCTCGPGPAGQPTPGREWQMDKTNRINSQATAILFISRLDSCEEWTLITRIVAQPINGTCKTWCKFNSAYDIMVHCKITADLSGVKSLDSSILSFSQSFLGTAHKLMADIIKG